MVLFSASLARRQDTTEPLNATTDPAVPTTAPPPDSTTFIQSSSEKSSAIPPTTAQSERDTSTSLSPSIPSSTPSVLFNGPQYSPPHSLLGWQIGLIAACAAVIFIVFPWVILLQLRRTRFRPRHGNIDLLASERRGRSRGGAGGHSHETSAGWAPPRTLVDFLSFGSAQDGVSGTRSYFSGTTSLSDPPPAYNAHPANRRVSAAPSYRSHHSGSLRAADHRHTRGPTTRLPMLGLVLPEGDEGWSSEFDRELKSLYTPDGIDPETPATPYISSPLTGGTTEKR